MKTCAWIFIFILCIHAHEALCQTLFTEPFDETSGSVTGVDNTGGVSWNATCTGCVSGVDWYEVRTNALECEDTNGPAVWTTGNIDITPCTSNALISVTINAAGGMEECTAGCGCNCVDWVLIEYAINGGSFASATSPAGGACSQGCTGGNYTLIGDATTFPFTFSYCIPSTGSTLVLRITAQTWANGERYRIDNISVECFSCVLPLEITAFTAEAKNQQVELTWNTLNEAETEYFIIEKAASNAIFMRADSVRATGFARGYYFTDENPTEGINYYRIKQVNRNGTVEYSETVSADVNLSEKLTATPISQGVIITGCHINEEIAVADVSGHVIYTITPSTPTCMISYVFTPGFYLLYTNGQGIRRQSAFFVH